MKQNDTLCSYSRIAVVEAYGLYLMTGIAAACIGASMIALTGYFQVSVAQVAALSSAFALGRVAMVFFCGIITEKLGVRKSFMIGYLALGINFVFMPLNTHYWLALILMAIAGMGMGFQDSGCPVILSRAFPLNYSGAMSAGQAFFGIGNFIPPLTMSLLLLSGLSWKVMFFIFGGMTLALFVATFFMPRERILDNSGDHEHGFSMAWLKRQGKFFFVLFLTNFFYCSLLNIVHIYTNPYVLSFGIHESISVNVLTMFSVGAVIGSLAFVRILRRARPVKVLLVNLVIAFLSLCIAIISGNIIVFFIMFTVAGAFSGVLFSVLVTLATDAAPRHTAMAASLIGFTGGISDILTPLAVGRVVTVASVRIAFPSVLLATAIAVVGAYMVIRLQPRKQQV